MAGNIDNTIQNTGLSSDITQEAMVAVTANGVAGLSSISTLGVSQTEQVQDSLNISIPWIPPPAFNDLLFSGLSDRALSASITKADTELNRACLDMLDKWSDSIRKEIEVRKEWENSPAHMAQEERKMALDGILRAAGASAGVEGSALTPVFTVGLVFASGGGVIDAMLIDTLSTDLVGVNPSKNGAPLPPQTPDMRAELGLIGAAFLQGLFTHAQWETLSKVEGGGKSEAQTAKSFAEGVQTLLASGQLSTLIQSLVLAKMDKGEAANTLIDRYTRRLSVILLAAALASLYKSEKEGGTGHITPEEFLALIQGTNKTFGPNKALMDQVLSSLQTLMKSLPTKEGDTLMVALLQFMNTNPSMKTLTNPKETLQAMATLNRRRASDAPA